MYIHVTLLLFKKVIKSTNDVMKNNQYMTFDQKIYIIVLFELFIYSLSKEEKKEEERRRKEQQRLEREEEKRRKEQQRLDKEKEKERKKKEELKTKNRQKGLKAFKVSGIVEVTIYKHHTDAFGIWLNECVQE